MIMRNIPKKLKRWLLVFLITANIGVPFAESLACGNHLVGRSTDGKGIQITHMKLTHVTPLSGENTTGASEKEQDKGDCSICLNAIGLSLSYNENTTFPSISYALEPVKITLSERLSSIYKPPKNL
jgi:hypothetical protein